MLCPVVRQTLAECHLFAQRILYLHALVQAFPVPLAALWDQASQQFFRNFVGHKPNPVALLRQMGLK